MGYENMNIEWYQDENGVYTFIGARSFTNEKYTKELIKEAEFNSISIFSTEEEVAAVMNLE